ncbi:hypothetical protein TYRP_002365 [Tyrophagus putrescentiae]|nr:hypothetical protein TYRP_002365 [Tyrophagus putrescentiae]
MPPPLRPLPDLCLIAVFKQLTPVDQLTASLMSLRCEVLVRAANRRVKTLTFTCSANLEFASKKINGICLASKPSMQLTNSVPSFADYPLMTGRLSKWNSLQIEQLEFDYWTVEQIVSIFSAVTDLKLLVNSSHQIAFLAVLLTHCQWRGQLTELLFFIFDETAITDQFSCFLTAINGLSSLQALAIKIPHAVEEIPGLNNLKALVWLKVIAVKIDSWFVPLFMRSLERYAADNAHLQVHLFSNGNSLLNLDEPLRGRVVRYVNSGVEDHANSIPFSLQALLLSHLTYSVHSKTS